MDEARDADAPPLTCDAFFGGRLALRQPARGHRGGTDAVLLAAAVPRDCGGLVYDAGAGVGTAGLGIALACPGARVGLIENDPLSARLAAENVVANGLAARVDVHACDLLSAAARRAAGVIGDAALVVTNPPFHEAGSVRASPDPRRAAAHLSGIGGLEAWIAACLALLGPHGHIVLIHRADALPQLLGALDRRVGAITVLPIQTRIGADARRILVRAIKGSRAPFAIAPALCLQDERGAFTPALQAINRGEAALAW